MVFMATALNHLPERRREWLTKANQWKALPGSYLVSMGFVDSQVE
jgi:hypothetical protein